MMLYIKEYRSFNMNVLLILVISIIMSSSNSKLKLRRECKRLDIFGTRMSLLEQDTPMWYRVEQSDTQLLFLSKADKTVNI